MSKPKMSVERYLALAEIASSGPSFESADESMNEMVSFAASVGCELSEAQS